MSINEAKRKFPNISRKAVELKAQEMFDSGAKKFLLETIKLCKKLRPKAKWGFYDYPSCNYDAGHQGETECSKKYQSINERLLWLYKEVGALYPQIYLYKKSEDRSITQSYIHAKAMEAEWIQIITKRSIPLYFYSKIEYSPYINRSEGEHFYNKEDLCDTIGYPLNIGADGIVLWSTSTNMQERCPVIKNYFEELFGPYIKHFNKKMTSCEKRLCNKHGRCILQDRMPKVGCFPKISRYMCICDKGYTGENYSSLLNLLDRMGGFVIHCTIEYQFFSTLLMKQTIARIM
uniref:Hyaluronidase n=1 Tax=Acrobeloides nanus TaxID=290746 RepID=A0A914DHS2_9BILA